VGVCADADASVVDYAIAMGVFAHATVGIYCSRSPVLGGAHHLMVQLFL